MSQSGTIAISVLIASFLLSLRIPANVRSWSDKARFHRSGAIVVLVSLNCFQDDIPPHGLFIYVSYMSYVIAANLMTSQLRSFGSVWTGRRLVLLTRVIMTAFACLIAWQGESMPAVFVLTTLCAGIAHACLARSESKEIIMNYKHLQNRLATLESSRNGIYANAAMTRSEARDKSREAS